MSRKTRHHRTGPIAPPAAPTPKPFARAIRMDQGPWGGDLGYGMGSGGFSNQATGLGTSRDKRLATTINGASALTREARTALYANNDLVARVVDIVPQEMLREGWSLPSDVKGELHEECEALGVRQALREALTWSRLQGGAVIVLGVQDGRRIDQPLDEAGLTDITYLTVLDAHEARPKDWYNDPLAPKFGQPRTYELWPLGTPGGALERMGTVIHESRLLRFEGQMTPRSLRQQQFGWGSSVVDRVYEVIRDTTAAYGGMAHLLQDFVIDVYEIQGLAEKLNADEDGDVLARLMQLAYYRGIGVPTPLDAEFEDFRRVSPTAVSGLADLIDRMNLRLSAATGIPLSLLWGQGAAGMNATGEGDQSNFINVIKAQQVECLQAPLTRLLTIIAKAKGLQLVRSSRRGTVPFEFNPLWTPSLEETAKARFAIAQADQIYNIIGVLSPDDIRENRFVGGFDADTNVSGPAPGPQVSPDTQATIDAAPDPAPTASNTGG